MPSILITGCSSGIGLAAAARFHAAGWQMIATVRNPDDASRLRAQFSGVDVVEVDLCNEAAVFRVIGDVLAARGGVDVLVNNAGASIIGAAEELSLADYRAQLDINLLAGIHLSQLCLPYMRARKSGRIVQVSSGFGRIALPIFSAYCAAKFALEGFSEALAHEVAPFGVQVSLVEPGTVATKFDSNRREAQRYDGNGPYATLYQVMRARLAGAHERSPSSADDVAEVIFSAATSRRPSLRYTVGRMGFAADFAARFVPDSLKQFAVSRMQGDKS